MLDEQQFISPRGQAKAYWKNGQVAPTDVMARLVAEGFDAERLEELELKDNS